MARTQGSDDLFRLIHSLTPEEKGYFKKFAKRHTPDENKYLQLFDAINLQQKFEEALLKKSFGNYTVMKSYLFDMVLQSLLFSSDITREKIDALENISKIEILIQRQLRDKALKLAEKQLQEASKTENYWLEKELMNIVYRLKIKQWPMDEAMDGRLNHYASVRSLLRKEETRNKLEEMRDMLGMYETLSVFKKRNPFPLSEYIDVDFLRDERNDLSLHDKRVRLHALAYYYYIQSNPAMQLETVLRLNEFEKKLFTTQHPGSSLSQYITSMRNVIYSLAITKKTTEARKILEEHKKIKVVNRGDEMGHYLSGLQLEHYIYFHSGQHEEGEKFSRAAVQQTDLKKWMTKYPAAVLEIYKNKALFEFSKKHFDKMHQTLGDLQELDLKNMAPRYQKNREFIRIATEIECSNYDSAARLIANLFRSGIKDELDSYDRKVLNLLKKINARNKNEILQRLLDLPADEYVNLMGALTFKIWVTSLLYGKSISQLFAETVVG